MTNDLNTAPILGVSSWALHHELGAPPIWGVEAGEAAPHFEARGGAISLLELPALLAERGFSCYQICHFHLPTRDAVYLDELRAASVESGLVLHAFLVDAGDISHAANGQRDAHWIAGWLDVAARLGADNLRAIAGQTAREGALEQSARHLLELAQLGKTNGVNIITENWFDLLATPQAVRELLARTEGQVELLLDWSNWNGPRKYERLAMIAPLARSCHAQIEFDSTESERRINRDDCLSCVQLPYADDFGGPFVLVNGGLQGIEVARDAIRHSWHPAHSDDAN